MSCEVDLIPWFQLTQRLGTVTVDVGIVDCEVPQTPAGQLIRIVPLRHVHRQQLQQPNNYNSQLIRFVPLRHIARQQLQQPNNNNSQLIRIVALRHIPGQQLQQPNNYNSQLIRIVPLRQSPNNYNTLCHYNRSLSNVYYNNNSCNN